jgi:hypothetical protein
MAKYMILIYGDPRQWEGMPPEQQRAHDAAHAAFGVAAGSKIIAGAELAEASGGSTLRSGPTGRVVTTDGPFLETKEVLGGYHLLEAADLDEVITLAAQLPEVHASHSGTEIRPVVDHG